MSQKPWASPADQTAAIHTPPPQERPDSLSFRDFWTEVEHIRQGSSDSEADCTARDSRHTEEGEQEKQWLQDAGLSTLISEDSEDVDKVVLLSTLTRTQAAAVQRRLDSYTCSLRKRSKQPPRDVRDIFSHSTSTQEDNSQVREREGDTVSPPVSLNKTPSAPPCCVCLPAVSVDSQGSVAREEVFSTDIAYCEQAAILLKQAKQPRPGPLRRRRDEGALTKVVSPQCRLGVTRIQDLSAQDMKKVRQLALIDMTALCDLLELDLKRHKIGKRKIPESSLFGVPLATLVENDQKIKPNAGLTQGGLSLPSQLLSFLEKKGLDSEGILRVPGSQARIKVLQQKLESSFYNGGFSWEEMSPNDAAALLKKFIRELPTPLLTAEHLSTFSAVRDILDLKPKLWVLNLLVLLLPEPNRSTLKALLDFLSRVVSHERRNRMSLWAVSTIMAPNLFMHKAVPCKLAEGEEKGQAELAADVMRLLIRHQDLLWTIPNFLMSQVRKMNENSSRRYQFYDRRIKSLLRKIHTESREKQDKNTSEPCRTVKIQLGELLSSTMEVRLSMDSQASDLLTQFQRDLRSSENGKSLMRSNGTIVYPDCAIYEVGGNIGEHCLDPNTHLLDLYNSNPRGEWVIRLKPGTSRGL
ncbi:RHG40 protein, partial [Amia calva]|nr:RHG40 protein [Amia calva]